MAKANDTVKNGSEPSAGETISDTSAGIENFPDRDDRATSTIDRGSQEAAISAPSPGNNAAAEPPITRTRKQRTAEAGKRTTKEKKLDLNPDARAQIVKNVVAIHAIADNWLAPKIGVRGCLTIDERESKSLVDATAAVLDQYDVSVSPKTAAWLNLGAVMAAVYGMRIALVKAAIAEAKQSQQINQPVIKTPEAAQTGAMKFQ